MKYGNNIFSKRNRRYSIFEKDEQSGHIEKNQTFDKGYSKSPFNGLGKPKPLKMNLRGLGQGELQINID